MKRVEDALQSTPLNPNDVVPAVERPLNDGRLPCNVEYEIFNENQLLKNLLQDDIAEGM